MSDPPRVDAGADANGPSGTLAGPSRVGAGATSSKRSEDLGGLRALVVYWCFWLLGSWAVAWLSDTSVPRVRWMLFAGAIGLMLVWPAFRLSQRVSDDEPGRGAAQIFFDWLAMVMVYQAVIWSLHLIAGWPWVRGLWLDGAVVAWSACIALIVAAVRLWPSAGARLLGMALCIALVFAEPVALWWSIRSGGPGWDMRASPIQAFWELTGSPTHQAVADWGRQILLVGFVALSGWAALGLWALGERVAYRRR